MEVIYPRACGVDVHKKFIVAVICISEGIKPRYIRKRFSTYNNDLIKFRDWLIQNDCLNVCMESTGKYYIPVYNVLEEHISNIVVANPKWVKCVKGEKDDNKDAKWIADLFKLGIVRGSFIPEKQIRLLREMTRYLFKITNMRSSEKNRYINALTVGNCKLDMVFSDIFGKTSSDIINIILNNDSYTDEDIINCLRKNCKASKEDILNAISGISFEGCQKERIILIKEHIDYITNEINKLKEIINQLVSPYEDYITLLCTIPGINRDSAITIISEIGTDMKQFSSHYKLAAWAGLAPGCNESAGKKKSVKISRAGVYLKPCLVEVAHAAIKDKDCPYYANKYNKIVKRRGKKRTIIAIARKILVAIYHMMLTGETFNPSDLATAETNDKDRLKYTKNNLKQDIKQLTNLGLTTDEIIELITAQNAN
ncbi:MAG: IS110 family transposase [Candidatus Coprovivens sp.]